MGLVEATKLKLWTALCMFLLLVVPVYLSINHPRAFLVQMFPAVRAHWTTPLTL